MKIFGYFISSFLVFLGIFLLLYQFDIYIFFNLQLTKFWPLLFVLFGVSILNLPKWLKIVFMSISGIYCAFLIISIYSNINASLGKITELDFNNYQYATSSDFIINDSSTKYVNLEINSGISSLKMSDTTINDKIYLFNQLYKIQDIDENYAQSNDSMYLKDDLITKNITIVNDSISNIQLDIAQITFKKYINNFKLNSNLVYSGNFSFGASNADFDLQNLAFEKINLESGASNIRLKIGSKLPEVRINVDAGLSKLRVFFPKESKCILQTDSEKINIDFVTNGRKKGEFQYIPKNPNGNVIYVNCKSGISSVSIEHY